MNSTLADTWKHEPPSTYLLWVDGVGGFQVCLGQRVTLGQANGQPMADIAILADVSRHHATIQRDSEGYFLEAVRKVALNGQPTEKAFLHSGDRLTLGNSCQWLFTQPVPISASARLDPASGHRLLHPVDAVLLMADTLVLGPGQAHVPLADASKPIILYRQKNGLAVRHEGTLLINGQAQQGFGTLEVGARVATETLSFTLESCGRKESIHE